MIVSNAQVRLASRHEAFTKIRREQSVKMWVGAPPPDVNPTAAARVVSVERVTLSAEAFRAASVSVEARSAGARRAAQAGAAKDAPLPRKLGTLKLLLEKMTGVRIRVEAISLGQNESGAPVFARGEKSAAPPEPGFGMIYRFHETTVEAEKTAIVAEGTLTTADGRTLDFRADFEMARLSASETTVEIREGNAKLSDPLVLTLEGAPGRLAEATFRLDLDGDGTVDDVPWAAPGSAFLALDGNGDGVVGEASELFGPTSGDGFGELAAYDADHSGWIDEADPVFARLSLWLLGEGGEGRLESLSQAGVGAIGLGTVASPFTVKDAQAVQTGQVRSTGIYVREEGGVGAIQHVDLVV